MNKFYMVTYSTIVTVDDSSIPATDIKKAVTDKAIEQINSSKVVKPSNIFEIKEAPYEVISENQTGEDKVPRDIHRGSQSNNGMGSTGKQEGPEDRKEMQGHEQGTGERNNSGQTSPTGKAS